MFVEKLKKVFEENHIEIIEYNGEKQPITYKCLDCGKIYKFSCARNLLGKITLCKKCWSPFNRWNKERLKKYKLDRLYPDSDLEILTFKSFNSGGEIKCLKCGTIEKINNFESLLSARKGGFCNNCEKDKNITYQRVQEEIKKGFLTLLEWNGVREKAKFQCNRCKHIFFKNVRTNFNGEICPNCFKVHNTFSFERAQEFLKDKLGEDYTLLQYKGYEEKSLIKHKCGLIYSKRFSDIEKSRGCPKCFVKFSKLEQKVEQFLIKHKITYERQKRFEDLKRFSFDFAIKINEIEILLEVQGQQHYKEIEIFGDFQKQKDRDLKKKEYCLINNIPLIEIPYWEINNLEIFLPQKFKDYLEKE